MTKARADALVVLSDRMFFGEREQIADLAGEQPGCQQYRGVGGVREVWWASWHTARTCLGNIRRAATYVDRSERRASRPTYPSSSHKFRVRYQHEDCEDARPDDPAIRCYYVANEVIQ